MNRSSAALKMNPDGNRTNGAHHKLPGCPNIEETSFKCYSYGETCEDKGIIFRIVTLQAARFQTLPGKAPDTPE